jgi:hypothetical protein
MRADVVNAFLGRIAVARTEGGWVVIGNALGQQLERDLKALTYLSDEQRARVIRQGP